MPDNEKQADLTDEEMEILSEAPADSTTPVEGDDHHGDSGDQ
jgi:hypothetical protein